MEVRVISITQPIDGICKTAEDLIVYTARVSSPQNQDNIETGAKLLSYCIRKKHWSIFTMADMTVEITTSRAISAQVLRHQSFNFQEFSQRYAAVNSFETYNARRQDAKNRQNSTDDLGEDIIEWFFRAQEHIQEEASDLYQQALDQGIAKECARFLLPMSATTKIYMKGSVRSWLTYFMVRCSVETQKEHRDIAKAIWPLFAQHFPITAEAVSGLDDYAHLKP